MPTCLPPPPFLPQRKKRLKAGLDSVLSAPGSESVSIETMRCLRTQVCTADSRRALLPEGRPLAVESIHFTSLHSFNFNCMFHRIALLCVPVILLRELLCVKCEVASCCRCSWKLQVSAEVWESGEAVVTYLPDTQLKPAASSCQEGRSEGAGQQTQLLTSRPSGRNQEYTWSVALCGEQS